MMVISPKFWRSIDQLIADHKLVIDRPKQSKHPRYPEAIYPLDYGFLEGTTSGDGHGIDVWIGSDSKQHATGVMCTIDLLKKDIEIKILLDCTQADIQKILSFAEADSIAMHVIMRDIN